jgi:hypothetical protein
MKKLLLVIVLVILISGTVFLMLPAHTTKASAQEIFGMCVSSVPQEWGQFRGGSEQTGLAFEDRQGTLRFVTSFPCNGLTPPVALEVRRTSRN